MTGMHHYLPTFHIFGKVSCQQGSLVIIWLPQHHLNIFNRPEKKRLEKKNPLFWCHNFTFSFPKFDFMIV